MDKSFEPHRPLILEAETYRNEYFILGHDLYFFKRIQNVEVTREEIDTFGKFWALAIAELSPGQVSIRRGTEWVDVVGPQIVWIPPHSVVHWRLGGGALTWFSYLSSLPKPDIMPDHPVMFRCSEFFWPQNLSDLRELFKKSDGFTSLTPATHNPWALKLKKQLDSEFNENHRIEYYAQKMDISHETLTRAFHEEFGLPPVQYRNKIRLTQAMVDILMSGKRISEISQAVGFKDQSHFHHLFRREIRSRPSRFRF